MAAKEDQNLTKVTEDIEPWVRRIVQYTVTEHAEKCAVRGRVERLELKVYVMVAMMLGSGGVGGVIGAGLAQAGVLAPAKELAGLLLDALKTVMGA
jgi:hypothetical protein